MEYGTESTIITYKEAEIFRTAKHFRIRVKVSNPQEEMTEYIRFTQEIAEYRDKGMLIVEDPPPSFEIHYPKTNVDGYYFIVKSYCIITFKE